jgi:hypothetical protein
MKISLFYAKYCNILIKISLRISILLQSTTNSRGRMICVLRSPPLISIFSSRWIRSGRNHQSKLRPGAWPIASSLFFFPLEPAARINFMALLTTTAGGCKMRTALRFSTTCITFTAEDNCATASSRTENQRQDKEGASWIRGCNPRKLL